MTSFYGTESYAIDHKGRLAIPAEVRRPDGRKQPIKSFYLVAFFEGCLALYTPEQWNGVIERVKRRSGGRKGRKFSRAFFNNVKEVPVDSQGRVTIPSVLMSRAGLEREAVLHGLPDRVEIWNPKRHEKAMAEADSQFEEFGEEVFGEE